MLSMHVCSKAYELKQFQIHSCLRQDPLQAILVIFGRSVLNFFFFVVWKVLEKNEKRNHFCVHAQ